MEVETLSSDNNTIFNLVDFYSKALYSYILCNLFLKSSNSKCLKTSLMWVSLFAHVFINFSDNGHRAYMYLICITALWCFLIASIQKVEVQYVYIFWYIFWTVKFLETPLSSSITFYKKRIPYIILR